jgi:hypothetical protein
LLQLGIIEAIPIASPQDEEAESHRTQLFGRWRNVLGFAIAERPVFLGHFH